MLYHACRDWLCKRKGLAPPYSHSTWLHHSQYAAPPFAVRGPTSHNMWPTTHHTVIVRGHTLKSPNVITCRITTNLQERAEQVEVNSSDDTRAVIARYNRIRRAPFFFPFCCWIPFLPGAARKATSSGKARPGAARVSCWGHCFSVSLIHNLDTHVQSPIERIRFSDSQKTPSTNLILKDRHKINSWTSGETIETVVNQQPITDVNRNGFIGQDTQQKLLACPHRHPCH